MYLKSTCTLRLGGLGVTNSAVTYINTPLSKISVLWHCRVAETPMLSFVFVEPSLQNPRIQAQDFRSHMKPKSPTERERERERGKEREREMERE